MKKNSDKQTNKTKNKENNQTKRKMDVVFQLFTRRPLLPSFISD